MRFIPMSRLPISVPRSRSGQALPVGLLVATSCVLWACGPTQEPTFADVAPILHGNCASCHRPSGPGPMALVSYDDAASVADLVASTTSQKRMPPWLPARDAGLAFRDQRILSSVEIDILRRWAEAGAPRGDVSTLPPPPVWSAEWALGAPDLILEMEESFTVPPSGGHDLFRTFVLRIPTEGARWVRAVELIPDNPKVVHHATMRVDQTRSSRLAAEADPLPGYDALIVESAARPPGGFFLGWTPGLVPTPFPEGTAWRLEPGMDFVVELHLRPSADPEDVSVRVGLHFSDEEPDRIPAIVRLGAQTIDIEAGDSMYVVEDAFRLPVTVRAIGAYPHAHYLARSMEVWGESPEGRRIPLMDIPSWDFDWQDAYYYADPVELPAGTILRMRYSYDNSGGNPRNPHDPPERVLWGLFSQNEMAEFWLQVVTSGEDEREELVRVAQRRDVEKQIEGWEHLVAVDPTHPDAQVGLAEVAHARGDNEEALRRYALALAARPEMTMAHHGRGRVLEDVNDVEGAVAAYQAALAVVPNNLSALSDLGRLHHLAGRPGRAREFLEKAVELDSTFRDALINLGSVLLEQGELDEAERRLRRAVMLHPEAPEAYFNLAVTLVSKGSTEEGIETLRRGVELDGDQLQPAVTVAWILATDPDESVRNPEVAADLALQVREVTGPDPVVSDVAAAAFAAMGAFIEAGQLIEEAIAAAEALGAEALLSELHFRRGLYRSGESYGRPDS